MRLAEKLAVVTAAASGMGRAGVELFLREGAQVAAIDVNAEALDKLAAEVAAKGHAIHTVVADLSRAEDCKNSIHAAAGKLGG
ncbi:MAG: SDR family NAD(P)-dependent oxidoreductase, partial [Pseudaminobacter sp.]